MIWSVRFEAEEVLVLKIRDTFLTWLLPRVQDAEVRRLDPYCDATLNRNALLHWQTELVSVRTAWRAQVARLLTETRRLPVDQASRDALLAAWVERKLSADENVSTLLELEAAVALALESNGVIEVTGD